MKRLATVLLLALPLIGQSNYKARVSAVRKVPGLVAFWDFVRRDGERFDAYAGRKETADFRLDPVNYVQQFWNEGRAATMADFPMVGSGPFGDAVRIVAEKDATFRPVLVVPRVRLHDSGLDVKGAGKSVTLVAWIERASGNHAIAGIWHEGTDLAANSTRVENGMRQYALFAGLAANNGGLASHVSENGGKSFGDKYARNLSVTPEKIPAGWVMVGLRFDNRKNEVTSSVDGKETDYWIEKPETHPFFQWVAKGYCEGTYTPPEGKVLKRENDVLTYAYTKVKVVDGKRELVALRVNPFWFGHDLFTPESRERGGPFTIGRVIHSSRSVGFTGSIGGVAVFDRALPLKQLQKLAAIGRGVDGKYDLIQSGK